MNRVEKFKKAFFDLPSRKFGETFVQPILYKVLGDVPYKGGNDCDAFRKDSFRVEYKAVRVVFNVLSSRKSLYDKILASQIPMSKRIGTLKNIKDGDIGVNCQNIKLDDFDYLDYVLVDDYGFHIFEISGKKFRTYTKNGTFPSWSPNHGSKEKGKNGQFPINSGNLSWHMKFFKKKVPWKKIMDIAMKI